MSGPHLSDAACRVAAMRCASRAHLKAAVGTARRVSRHPALAPAPIASRALSSPRQCPASRTPPSPRPPRRHPDHLTVRAAVPTEAARPSPSRRAGEPPFLAVSRAPAPCRRLLAEQRRHQVVPPPRARAVRRALCGSAELGRPSAAHAGRALSGRGPRPHCATGPSAVSAQ
jgi:hypothetical protein